MRALLLSLTLPLLGLAGSQSRDRRGQFSEMTIRVGKGPKWITAADVNHDGNPDLVVANADGGTVTVLLGNGKGQFHEPAGSPFAAGHLPNDISIADMNGDGNPDLVIADHQSPFLTILLADGKGGFRSAPGSPVDVHSHPHPHGVVAADFNGDGHPDVVTDSWGTNQIELLLGDGKGGLKIPGKYFATGRRPYERLRSADFNRDGIPDIVTTNLDDGTVTILLGDGKGGFRNAPGSPFAAGAKPWEVAIDDVDGDGNADLLVIPYERDVADPSQNALTILRSDGMAGFKPMADTPLPLAGCHGPNSVTAGDLYGNGRQDVVVSCAESRNLLIFARDGNGHFAASSEPTKGGWGAVTMTHLRGSRRGELVTANEDDGSITVLSAN
jgi:hypothetical protein